MTKKTVGIIYSTLSAIALVPLVFMQLFSVFLFDDPNQQGLAVILALCILMIPVVLILGNIFMWRYIKRENGKLMLISMLVPIVYPVIFFSIWASLG